MGAGRGAAHAATAATAIAIVIGRLPRARIRSASVAECEFPAAFERRLLGMILTRLLRSSCAGALALAALAGVAAADPPDNASAVALVTAWRTAVHAAPCDRKKPSDPVVCSGAALVPMMPAPVQFGVETNGSLPDGCEPWSETKGLASVKAGASYDML